MVATIAVGGTLLVSTPVWVVGPIQVYNLDSSDKLIVDTDYNNLVAQKPITNILDWYDNNTRIQVNNRSDFATGFPFKMSIQKKAEILALSILVNYSEQITGSPTPSAYKTIHINWDVSKGAFQIQFQTYGVGDPYGYGSSGFARIQLDLTATPNYLNPTQILVSWTLLSMGVTIGYLSGLQYNNTYYFTPAQASGIQSPPGYQFFWTGVSAMYMGGLGLIMGVGMEWGIQIGPGPAFPYPVISPTADEYYNNL